MKIGRVMLIIFLVFGGYVASLFFRYHFHRDANDTVGQLQSKFLSSGYTRIPNSNDRIITFAEGEIKSKQNYTTTQIYFTPKAGPERLLNLPGTVDLTEIAGFYIDYPYLLVLPLNLDSTGTLYFGLLAYNLENNKQKTLHIETFGCGNSIHKVAYKKDTIFWSQYKEWNVICTGSFSKKFKLDF